MDSNQLVKKKLVIGPYDRSEIEEMNKEFL